jgi:hypothetical protein
MFKGKEKCQFTSFATTFVFFTKYCLHYKPTHHISLLKNMEQQAIQGINITQWRQKIKWMKQVPSKKKKTKH